MEGLRMVKTIIRSCIVSKPEQQSTAGQLNHDYHTMEGEFIPFKLLGFNSLHELLLAIPDTVYLPFPADRSFQSPVRVVKSEKTAHVESLVQRQSSNSKRRSRTSQRVRPGVNRAVHRPYMSASHYHAPPTTHRRIPPANTYQAPTRPLVLPTHRNHAMRPISPTKKTEEIFLPDAMKEVFITVARQHPGLSLKELERKVNVLTALEVSDVYNSVEDVVRSITELWLDNGEVYVRENAAVSLVNANGPRIIPAGEEDRNSNYNYFLSDDENEYNGKRSSQCKATRETPVQSQGAGSHRLVSYPDSDGSECSADEFLPPDDDYDEPQECRIPTKIGQRILDLLEKESDGIWCSSLADEYQKVYRQKLDFIKSGYVSVVQMLLTTPEYFFCKQIDNGDWKVYAQKNVPEPFIPESTVQRIEELLMSLQSGIDIDDFPLEYEKMFGEPFDHAGMNYSTLAELFSELSGSVHMSQANGCCRLYAAIIPPLDVTGVIPAPKLAPSVLSMFRDDVVGLGYEFPRLVMPPYVKQHSDIEVIIAAVVNIDRFYVQLRSLEYSKKVDELEEQMRLFYEQEAGKYRVPVPAIVQGLYCVAKLNGEFNRLKVTRVNDNDTVNYMYVDYGNTAKIEMKMLHFMHKKFALLPGQAIQCRCANLIPPNGLRNFEQEAGKRLLDLVRDKGIVATISQVFPDRLWMWVSLVDTTGDEDVHINDKLVEEGFATFFRDHITTALLRLTGMSAEEFINEMQEQTKDVKDLPLTGYQSTYMTGSVTGSMSRTVTGSIGRSRSIAGSMARTRTSVAGSELDLTLPSRGRRTSPVCPPIEELEKSFARQTSAQTSRSPASPAPVAKESAVASVRPPPGFKAMSNTQLPADVASILAKQTPGVRDTSLNYQSTAATRPAESPRTPDKVNSTLNIGSPEFVPRTRFSNSNSSLKSESVVSIKLPTEPALLHPKGTEVKRVVVQQQQVLNRTGVPLRVTPLMCRPSMIPPNTQPYPQSFYPPQLVPPQMYPPRLPNFNPYVMQPQLQYVQNPFHPQEYLHIPYNPTPASHFLPQRSGYMPQQPGYMPRQPGLMPQRLIQEQQYAYEIGQALNRIRDVNLPQEASASSISPKKVSDSFKLEASDLKCEVNEDSATVIAHDDSRLDGDNLTDEAKEELLSPETNTSFDKTLEEDIQDDVDEGAVDLATEEIDSEVKEENQVADRKTDKVMNSFDEEGRILQAKTGDNLKAVTQYVMCDQNVLVFNIDGKIFLEVKEVIGLSDLKINVALKILKSKEVSRKFNDVKKKTHTHIFEEMSQFNSDQWLSVQLVPLQNVLELLTAVNVNINCLNKVEISLQQLAKELQLNL